MSIPTKVLSTRVSPEFHKAFTKMAKNNKLSTSKYLAKIIETPSPPTVLKSGGNVGSVVDKEFGDISGLLSAGGGLLLGSIVYNAIKVNVPDHYTDEQRKTYASVGALAVGLLTTFALYSSMSDE